MFKEIVPLVMSHHERVDGMGYPNGLKDDELPFLAKILTVADAFDAMTSNRVYRQKLSLDDTITQLIKGVGSQFDPTVVDMLVNLLKNGKIQINT